MRWLINVLHLKEGTFYTAHSCSREKWSGAPNVHKVAICQRQTGFDNHIVRLFTEWFKTMRSKGSLLLDGQSLPFCEENSSKIVEVQVAYEDPSFFRVESQVEVLSFMSTNKAAE